MKFKRRFFNDWVDTPLQKAMAIITIVMLGIAVIALICLRVMEQKDVSELTVEIVKCIMFFSCGLMCLSTSIGHSYNILKKGIYVGRKRHDIPTPGTAILTLTIGALFVGVGVYLVIHLPI